MNTQKQQALERLPILEKEVAELRKILEQPEGRKIAAKEYLLNILSKPFEVKLTKGYITYYQDGQWIFRQDLKNKYLWCYYYKVWEVFEKKYTMNYQQIQALIEEVVVEALNCKELTPLFRMIP